MSAPTSTPHPDNDLNDASRLARHPELRQRIVAALDAAEQSNIVAWDVDVDLVMQVVEPLADQLARAMVFDYGSVRVERRDEREDGWVVVDATETKARFVHTWHGTWVLDLADGEVDDYTRRITSYTSEQAHALAAELTKHISAEGES